MSETYKALGADVRQQIDSAEKILIVSHQFPDFDAIGSSLALQIALESMGKEVLTWSAGMSPAPFLFLPKSETIQTTVPESYDFDTLFVLDSTDLGRVDSIDVLPISENVRVINIDHHVDNTHFGDLNIVMTISSVGELLSHLFDAMAIPISTDMATCLYAAICFDTGRFAHSNVTAETMSACARLIQKGAQPSKIVQEMEETKTSDDFECLRKGLSRLIIRDTLAFTSLPRSSTKSAIKLVDYLRLLKTPDTFIVFQELSGKRVKINLRTRTAFNLSEFAARFGGGGHKKASGILYKGLLDPTIQKITRALEEALRQFYTHDTENRDN